MLWPIQLLTYFSRLRSLWRFWQYYCKEKVSSLFCSVVKSQIVCDICGTFVGPSSTTHSSSIAEHSSTITFQQNLISQDSLDPAFHVKPELVNAQLHHISISVSQCLKIDKTCLILTLILNKEKSKSCNPCYSEADQRPSGWQCCKMELLKLYSYTVFEFLL